MSAKTGSSTKNQTPVAFSFIKKVFRWQQQHQHLVFHIVAEYVVYYFFKWFLKKMWGNYGGSHTNYARVLECIC